jgi:hypothetical protein
MATKRYKRSPLPSKLHKELQRAALIVGLDVVYKGSRTNEKERRQRLYNLFHGDPNDSNNVSLLDHGCIQEESGWLLRVRESGLLLLLLLLLRDLCGLRFRNGPRWSLATVWYRFYTRASDMNPVPGFIFSRRI